MAESSRLLAAWLRTRVLRPRIALLWGLVSVAAWAAGAMPRAWVPVATVLLIVPFRLWDDLADLPRDSRRAPERVLVQATDLAPAWHALRIALGLVALALFVVQGWDAAAAYGLLLLAMWLLYRTTEPEGEDRHVRAMLVLAKYPVFVLLLAGPAGPRPWAAALLLYALLAAHERRSQQAEAEDEDE